MGSKGGGGGYYPPQQPPQYTDPISGKSFASTDELNAEITQRQADEKTASDAATATANQTAATNESTFQTNKQAAYDRAMQETIQSIQRAGGDPNQYMTSDIVPTLQRQLASIQDLDPNPGAAFPTNLGDTIVSNILAGKRTGALDTLNKTFTPTYADTAIPDSLTNTAASGIVNEQFDPLSAQLTNAQKRGTLSGPGYQAALDAMNQKRAAATTTVDNLGAGIVGADRSALNDYISGARTDANSLSLGANFDPNAYATGAATKVGTDVSDFGGALRNAVGDTKFSDITSLINAGGAVQGAQNPSAINPSGTPTTAGGGSLSPAYMSDAEAARQKRGLGNVGAF